MECISPIVQSCCPNPDKTETIKPNEILFDIYEITNPSRTIKDAGDSAHLQWNSMILDFKFKSLVTIAQNTPSYSIPDLFYAANAHKCQPLNRRLFENMKDFQVISVNPWNSFLLSGDTLTKFVLINSLNSVQYMEEFNHGHSYDYHLVISADPDPGNWQQIKIVVQFETYHLEALSPVFKIKP
ncbi:MAG: hypothetical protein KG003_14640 [Bacteroidetes bacterium]|nr:hypothetical protein [Bacteroidota bacterium]